MLVRVPMKSKHPGKMWITFERICEKDPVREINLLRSQCEPLGIIDDLLLLLSPTPIPGVDRYSIKVSVRFKKNHRFVSRFLPDHAQGPLEVLFVSLKWFKIQSRPRTLHLRIIPAISVREDETTPEKRLRRFLSHYVVEKPDTTLYTQDLWALWASLNPGSSPEDDEIAGIKRVSVWRDLRQVFRGFPPSMIERVGPETHRYWEGYSLRYNGTR